MALVWPPCTTGVTDGLCVFPCVCSIEASTAVALCNLKVNKSKEAIISKLD
jgi:hypothetical protein